MGSKCTSKLRHRKSVHQITDFKSFQTKVRTVRVIETKITSEYAFNGYYYGTEGNHKLSSDKISFLGIVEDL